jgi:hypothetical protein
MCWPAARKRIKHKISIRRPPTPIVVHSLEPADRLSNSPDQDHRGLRRGRRCRYRRAAQR